MSHLIDVYPYRIKEGKPEFFIGKRAPDKLYAGQWRMVGGKVKKKETAWKAALRELEEELGIIPDRFWSPPTINQFYEPSSDHIHHIPVFAAEVSEDVNIRLNSEHTEYKWITIDQAERYIYWSEQHRIISLIHNILRSKAILEEWEIPIDR